MKLIPRASLAIAAAAIVLVACSGGDGGKPSPTPSLEPTATSGPHTEVPGRPNDFADYAGVVGIYLTRGGGSVLGPPCLADLIADWDMPEPNVPLTPEQRCLVGNTDGDPDGEVIATFTAIPLDYYDSGPLGILSNTVIFDNTPDGYVAVYESNPTGEGMEMDAQRIVAAEDVTGDGHGDLVYTTTTCGAHTCTTSAHVVAPGADGYAALTPAGGISMETADVSVEDRTGDGVPDIALHGGTINSVGAGPQRTRTEVYSWHDSDFVTVETTYDPSDLLYFAIVDADALFQQGQYDDAVAAYLATVDDQSLNESGYHENEVLELRAYALFRAGLAQIASRDEDTGVATMQRAVDDYSDTLNAGLAQNFLASYEATGDLSSSCFAVRDYMDGSTDHTADAFALFWDFGYANPGFVKEDVCPL